MTPKHIDHFGVSARDVETSVSFYAGVLGLTAEEPATGKARHVRFPGGVIAVSPLREGESRSEHPYGDHFAFQMSETIDQLTAELSARQIAFQRTDGRVYVRDPDGYVLELISATNPVR